MSVRRYRDARDMEAPRSSRDDPELGRRIAELWRRAAAFAHVEPRPGVRKFRSIEELNRDREDRVAERMRALRARRADEPPTDPPAPPPRTTG